MVRVSNHNIRVLEEVLNFCRHKNRYLNIRRTLSVLVIRWKSRFMRLIFILKYTRLKLLLHPRPASATAYTHVSWRYTVIGVFCRVVRAAVCNRWTWRGRGGGEGRRGSRKKKSPCKSTSSDFSRKTQGCV